MGVSEHADGQAAVSVRIGIVGAGAMGREHAKAFASLAGVSVTGITSRTRSRAEAVAAEIGIPSVYESVAELYERTAPDLVVVAVPELSARSVATSVFEYPCDVLLEKPVGYDLADGEAIACEATAHARRVFVALNRRFYASTLAALKDLAQGDGRRFIRVEDQQDMAAAAAAGQPPLVVANWMYANSIHLVDYLRVFGRGAIASVRPIVRWNPDRPGLVISEVCFDSGDVGIYEGIWDGPGPWAVTISSPARRWELRPLERASSQRRGERRLDTLEPDAADVAFKAGFLRQAEAAVGAVRGEPSFIPTLADALETMRLVQRVFSLSG